MAIIFQKIDFMKHSSPLDASHVVSFAELLSRLANASEQSVDTSVEQYLAFSRYFKDRVHHLPQLKTFIDNLLDVHHCYPNTLIFNQIFQRLAKLKMTKLLCSMLEIAESRELVDVDSYKIVLRYLTSFKRPNKALIDAIFDRTLKDPTLFDSYTFKLQIDAMQKYVPFSNFYILEFLSFAAEKNVFNAQLCHATLRAMANKTVVLKEHIMGVFHLALSYRCVDLEMFEMVKSIFVTRQLGTEADFTRHWTTNIAGYPRNFYECEVIFMMFENSTGISQEALASFDAAASQFYPDFESYFHRIMNLLYQFKLELFTKYADFFEKRLSEKPFCLKHNGQTFHLTDLGEVELYFLMKAFWKKYQFLNENVLFQLQFEMSRNQHEAFLASLKAFPYLRDKMQKSDDDSYHMVIEPKRSKFILSEYSAFRPYQSQSSAMKSAVSVLKS